MSKSNSELTERFLGKRVAVIGDIMLDEHLWCEVSRISPEAPVPIARVKSTSHVPGGAGNVANNIVQLGGLALLIGTVGYDIYGDKLLEIMQAQHIDLSGIIKTQTRPTILKSRVIAHNQHVVRVDREKTDPILPKTEQKIMQLLEANANKLDAVLLSDYGKGLLTNALTQKIIRFAKSNNLVIAVDPKGHDYSKYRGATVLTPNKHEAEIAAKIPITDDATLIKVGQKLLAVTRLDNLLITRGEAGMSIFEQSGRITHIPTMAQSVFDITGAGDTAISTLILGLAAGLPIIQAAKIANIAAGIVVGKVGTAAVTIDELREQCK